MKQLEDQLALVPKERPVPTRLPRPPDSSMENEETGQKIDTEVPGGKRGYISFFFQNN